MNNFTKGLAILAAVGVVSAWAGSSYTPRASDQIPTTAPLNTDSAGAGATGAVASVVKIVCIQERTGGTGFVHRSGHIITAAHVVSDCERSHIVAAGVGIKGPLKVTEIVAVDKSLDLALLKTDKRISVPVNVVLAISSPVDLRLGAQVTTWGYPEGYGGLIPLLSVGYLSGHGKLRNPDKTVSPNRWFVNAAFNSGNSGGPLLRVEDSKVIGVVSSKLAPMPDIIESALGALSKQNAGFMYEKTYADGRVEKMSEGQVIHDVLQYLRRQTQLVIGHAVMLGDLRKFLEDNGVEP